MRAILVQEPGGPEKLEIGVAELPEPGPDEIRVRVRATALNRADILQRKGLYPPPEGASPILGLEMAGEVETVGKRCRKRKVGDRVCALLPGGGYAEYAVLPEKMAMPIPGDLSFEQAAAIPEVFLTAYQALFWVGQLSEGNSVLIHAGASGVGTAAIQLVCQMGLDAYVTAGSDAKIDACLELGAKLGVNYRNADFAERIAAATDGRGVDIVLDVIGASYFAQNISSLATDGRLVVLALMGGNEVEKFDLRQLMRKRIKLEGSTLRTRTGEYKIQLTEEFYEFSHRRFSDGRLKPVIDSTFPLARVADAHKRMEANLNIGKIVLNEIA